MLAEQNVRVIKAHSLQSITTSDWQAGRRQIATATFRSATGTTLTLAARMFIDGSYEGDLMALAGESYHGRCERHAARARAPVNAGHQRRLS